MKARAPAPPRVLRKLKPVFAANGSVTAGNSSQMSDGAGAVIVASEAALKRFNLTPIGRFLGTQWRVCRRKSWASARSRRYRKR